VGWDLRISLLAESNVAERDRVSLTSSARLEGEVIRPRRRRGGVSPRSRQAARRALQAGLCGAPRIPRPVNIGTISGREAKATCIPQVKVLSRECIGEMSSTPLKDH